MVEVKSFEQRLNLLTKDQRIQLLKSIVGNPSDNHVWVEKWRDLVARLEQLHRRV